MAVGALAAMGIGYDAGVEGPGIAFIGLIAGVAIGLTASFILRPLALRLILSGINREKNAELLASVKALNEEVVRLPAAE